MLVDTGPILLVYLVNLVREWRLRGVENKTKQKHGWSVRSLWLKIRRERRRPNS